MSRKRKVIGSMPTIEIRMSDLMRMVNSFRECKCVACERIALGLIKQLEDSVSPVPSGRA